VAAGVQVRTERVRQVEPNGGGLDVVLANSERVHRRALFVATRQHQQTDLAARLGCRLVAEGREAGAVAVDQTGRSSVPGVWAAGTTALPSLLAIGAAGHASTVATSLHPALLEQEIATPR
jgi:thioredoxin reductase (NADPH)